MPIRSFDEVEQFVLASGEVKTVALCGSHDDLALSALAEAKRKGIAKGILIGNAAATREILAQIGEPEDDWEIIDEPDEMTSCNMAIAFVREGRADACMKGLVQTSSYMRAVLNKETGILPKGHVLSETSVLEWPEQNRMVFATDCAINISPDLDTKVKLINNAVALAHCFEIEKPLVAAVSSLEKVNPKIESSVDAGELAKMEWADCIVEGPFALDNAVSVEAAEHKGVHGAVAGKADVLLLPDLDAGNVLHKSAHFFARMKMAVTVCGTDKPVILASRTDTANTKYNGIITALLQSIKQGA
ncbi:MAG: phosphate acyltransferase [Coriobacteriaceae bacterium]|nr:phosphate acyltransferase [Coriobacteriaceae bacterium]